MAKPETEESLSKQPALGRQWWELLRERSHSALLVAIVAAFAARPMIGENQIAVVVFSLVVVLLLVIALYTTQLDELRGNPEEIRRSWSRRRHIAWILGSLAALERLIQFIHPTPGTQLIGSLAWFTLFSFITWSQLRHLLRHKHVTSETISMSISTYLLIGFTWGVLYIVIYAVQPNAFNFGSGPPPTNFADVTSTLFYFSLTTIATVGYGDIQPMTLQARYASVAEGILGQFYLAILVARLVSLHMSKSPENDESRD